MFIPQTKQELVRLIRANSCYTLKEINKVYDDVVKKEPRRIKYYARKAGIKRLQAFYKSIIKKNELGNINKL